MIGRKLPPGEEADPSHGGWTLRNGNQENACERGLDEPAGTLFFGKRLNDVRWVRRQPATTILASGRTEDGGRVRPGDRAERTGDEGNGVRITLAEALILQDFPPDYPVQGTNTARFLQVGNAIPPGLARAILRELVG